MESEVYGCASNRLRVCACVCVKITECEIFMSLLVKFLDPEKPVWLRAAVIEVLGKLCSKPKLIW